MTPPGSPEQPQTAAGPDDAMAATYQRGWEAGRAAGAIEVERLRSLLELRPGGYVGPDRIPWFTHCGISHAEEAACIVCAALAATPAQGQPSEPSPLDVERLAMAMDRSPGVVTSGWGYTPEEHLAACREIAPFVAAEYNRLARLESGTAAEEEPRPR